MTSAWMKLTTMCICIVCSWWRWQRKIGIKISLSGAEASANYLSGNSGNHNIHSTTCHYFVQHVTICILFTILYNIHINIHVSVTILDMNQGCSMSVAHCSPHPTIICNYFTIMAALSILLRSASACGFSFFTLKIML